MPLDFTSSESSVTRNLRVAREILSRCYIVGARADVSGGHCALGALDVAIDGFVHNGSPEVIQLAKFAKLESVVQHDRSCLIAVHNNNLGKEATLQMFDEAIADSIKQGVAALA